VDPLDGTTNFVHGHPMFCVSVAAAHRGRLVAGVVHAPALGDTFAAARGLGARRNGAPIRVTRGVPLARAFLSTGFPYTLDDLAENNIAAFAHLAPRTLAIRRCGSAAIDLAYVAAGIYDGFWELGLGAWDLAAGSVLVMEAGGLVTDLEGGGGFLETGRIVAGEADLHAELLAALREARGGAREGR
jgi:myo-inositol-1(or 4)-monophosphatase